MEVVFQSLAVVLQPHHLLILICGVFMGLAIGILPGLGGIVGMTILLPVIYGMDPHSAFGLLIGMVAVIPTSDTFPSVMMGIPGSGSMAVFLGGLLILGIQPGPSMVTENVDLIYTAIWSLALANVLGASLSIALSKPITRLTVIPFSYLAPFMVMIITFACYQATRSWRDLIALLLMGVLGWVMKQYGWPRPAALIGFVLADNLETYLSISVQRYGLDWLKRPGVIVLACIIFVSLAMGIFFQTKRTTATSGGQHGKKAS